jgi:predicted nucleic acid-binding protein
LSQRVVIHDASVLIDLAAGSLLEDFGRLGWSSETTHFVLREIEGDPDLADWVHRHLRITVLSGEELIDLRLSASKGLSNADLSALYLARGRSGTLLTNDNRLRRQAEAANVPYLGILGIMRHLHEARICTGKRPCEALDAMLEAGARLPEKDCESLREGWGKG